MQLQREIHPTILLSLEGIVDQVRKLSKKLAISKGKKKVRIIVTFVVDGLVSRELVRRGVEAAASWTGQMLHVGFRKSRSG